MKLMRVLSELTATRDVAAGLSAAVPQAHTLHGGPPGVGLGPRFSNAVGPPGHGVVAAVW